MLAAVSAGPLAARAQSAAAVPKLDVDQFTASWYEMARLPDRREKQCVDDDLVLYGLRDKKDTFEVVISCLTKGDNWSYWNISGKLNPTGSGQLKLVRFFFLRTNYWVIAADPNMAWIVVGTPNHRSLEILSKTATLAPDVMDTIKAQIGSQGFNASKLVYVRQHGTQMNPDTGQKAAETTPPKKPPASNGAPEPKQDIGP